VKTNETALGVGTKFKCSSGGLLLFKEGWNIMRQAMRGEGATADSDLAGKWCENVTLINTQYVPKDIFNAEETAVLHFAT
jgi:hypothetical protein